MTKLALPAVVLTLASIIVGCAAPSSSEPQPVHVDVTGPSSAATTDAMSLELADGPELQTFVDALRAAEEPGVRSEDRVQIVVSTSSAGSLSHETFVVSRRSLGTWTKPLVEGNAVIVHVPSSLEKATREGSIAPSVFGWSWNDVVVTVKYTVGCYQDLPNGDVVDNCRS